MIHNQGKILPSHQQAIQFATPSLSVPVKSVWTGNAPLKRAKGRREEGFIYYALPQKSPKIVVCLGYNIKLFSRLTKTQGMAAAQTWPSKPERTISQFI